MKTLLLLLLTSFFMPDHAAMADKYYKIKQTLEDRNYTVVKNVYGNIAEGETVYYWKTFYANTTYAVWGYSDDDDVTDLDIEIQYDDGDTYRKDNESDSEPIVVFTPSYTRTMKVILTNYDSDTPSYESRCEFVIAEK